VLHAKLRNRTCQGLDRQRQGPSLQGPGQGQGLDLQGQGQGLTSLLKLIRKACMSSAAVQSTPTFCELKRSFMPLTRPVQRRTYPAADHHLSLAGTKLYWLAAEAHVWEQLAQGCIRKSGGRDSNLQPVDLSPAP